MGPKGVCVYALGQQFSDPEAGQILAQRLRQRLLGSTHASLACCVVICVVVVNVCVMKSLFVHGPLNPQLVSRPTSAAGAPTNRWAADGSSTSPPPTPSLTHSSERHVFSSKSLLHSKLSVLCE